MGKEGQKTKQRRKDRLVCLATSDDDIPVAESQLPVYTIHSRVDDVADRTKPTKDHEADVDGKLSELGVALEAQSVVNKVENVVDVTGRNQVDNLSRPEARTRGMDGVDEVDGDNEENTFDGTGECGKVKCASLLEKSHEAWTYQCCTLPILNVSLSLQRGRTYVVR